jgi:hypothetical protein
VIPTRCARLLRPLLQDECSLLRPTRADVAHKSARGRCKEDEVLGYRPKIGVYKYKHGSVRAAQCGSKGPGAGFCAAWLEGPEIAGRAAGRAGQLHHERAGAGQGSCSTGNGVSDGGPGEGERRVSAVGLIVASVIVVAAKARLAGRRVVVTARKPNDSESTQEEQNPFYFHNRKEIPPPWAR